MGVFSRLCSGIRPSLVSELRNQSPHGIVFDGANIREIRGDSLVPLFVEKRRPDHVAAPSSRVRRRPNHPSIQVRATMKPSIPFHNRALFLQ